MLYIRLLTAHLTDNQKMTITRIQLASANLQHFFVKALSWC